MNKGYTGGRVWIEDDDGDSTAWLEHKTGPGQVAGHARQAP